MAKHKDLKARTTHFKRGLAIATVLLTMITSLQISAASAVEPEPALVKNINETTQDAFGSSAVENEGSVVIGTTLYFSVAGGLWKSDGTSAGTVLVKQFDPALNQGISPYVMGTSLYFAANDGVHGMELWKSDGTTAGTLLLEDINLSGSSYPVEFEQMGGALYFFASNGTSNDLYSSTGAPGVATIYRTNSATSVGELTAVGSSLFFRGEDEINGSELWTSEGPSGATELLKKIRPNNGAYQNNYGSHPTELTAVGSVLYFRANDDAFISGKNIELWKSDGTTSGTNLIRDITVGTSLFPPQNFVVVGATLFFRANDGRSIELWKSDGTLGGTVMVTSPGSTGTTNGALIRKMIKGPSGPYVYFVEVSVAGSKLWKSDGATTESISDPYPSPNGMSSQMDYLTFQGPDLYFVAGADTSYDNLWKYDGASTVLVRATNSPEAYFYNLGILNSTAANLFLIVNTPEIGRELWKSDGTTQGTVSLKDINTFDKSGYELLSPTSAASMGSTFFFEGSDGLTGRELWKSDGTAEGTVMVKDIYPGPMGSSPRNLVAVGGTLFFSADDGNHGFELWKSDGTADGTVIVKDIVIDRDSSDPTYLVAVGGTLFFKTNDGVHGFELWKSDGTAEGTVIVKDIVVDLGSSNPENLVAVGSTLFFRANDGSNGLELWKSDGSAEGTVLVKDIAIGVVSGNPNYLVTVGSTLFFRADDGTHGEELWKSDGTGAGTVLVKDIFAGGDDSYLDYLAAGGSTLFFQADDGANGEELWKSDGTAEGTMLVKDIRSGTSGSSPRNLVAFGSVLFFSANDGSHGFEFWKSDGTAEGTVMVQDIQEGTNSSSPNDFFVVGSTLYFGPDDGIRGSELWNFSLASVSSAGSQSSGSSSEPTATHSPTPAPQVTEEPVTTKVVRFSQFAGDSAKLPARATRAIGVSLRAYSTIDRVVCTGFTSGVKATALGRKIALQRAQNACNVARLVAPKALIQVRANVASGVGAKFRTVQLSITGN